MNEQMLRDMMAQMIRVGFVAGRQPERMRVKVEFRDTTSARLVSDWLPVLTPRACADEQYDLPDDGDQVLCLFLPYGLEQGFVIGAMYGRANPPVASGDKWHRTFKDGTTLEYDRAAHRLKGDVQGDVELAVSGDVTVTLDGKLAATAQGPVDVASARQITLTAPVIAINGSVIGNTPGGGSVSFTGGEFSVNADQVSINEGCE